MTSVADPELPALGIVAPGDSDHFHDAVRELRAGGHWIVRAPKGMAVIEHDAVRDLLGDSRLRAVGIDLFRLQGIEDGGLVEEGFARTLINLEGEAHARQRRLLTRAFSRGAVDRLRPLMREWADDRARDMAARGGGEFIEDFAEDFPIVGVCELIGAPRRDWSRFSSWTADYVRIFDMNIAEDMPVIAAAQQALRAYVLDMIERRRHETPRDDLVSQLLQVEEAGDRLSHDELWRLVIALIIGGTDSVRNQLSQMVLLLARHPAEWERLVADPDLVPLAVEEGVRLVPATPVIFRVTRTEITYREVTIPPGTWLYLLTAAANRDPDRVECPMDVDVGAVRDPWAPATFGSGTHYCLGAALARAEMQEALAALVRRWRRIELAGEPEMRSPLGVTGPTRLPLRVVAR